LFNSLVIIYLKILIGRAKARLPFCISYFLTFKDKTQYACEVLLHLFVEPYKGQQKKTLSFKKKKEQVAENLDSFFYK